MDGWLHCGVTPQPPKWASGLAKRGPAAVTQSGGSSHQLGDPVGLRLGCCCRDGFLFLPLLFFPSVSDLVSVCRLTLVFRADIRQHQLTPASQSCSPSNTHSLFASYAYVCVTSTFFGRKPGFGEDFSGFQNPSWCWGREYVCSNHTT